MERLLKQNGHKLPGNMSLSFLRAFPSIRIVGGKQRHEFRFMVDGNVDRHVAKQRKAALDSKSGEEVKAGNVRMMTRAFINFEGQYLRVFIPVAVEQLDERRTTVSIQAFLISELCQVLRPANDDSGEDEADYVAEHDVFNFLRYLEVEEGRKAKSISKLKINEDKRTFSWVEILNLEPRGQE